MVKRIDISIMIIREINFYHQHYQNKILTVQTKKFVETNKALSIGVFLYLTKTTQVDGRYSASTLIVVTNTLDITSIPKLCYTLIH